MNNTIYYFASYDISSRKIKRRYTLAATTKIDYIISVLNQIGYNVNLISASYILDKKYVFDKGGKQKLNDKTNLFLSPSFGSKTIIGKYLGILFTSFCFFLKLLFIGKDDTLFVYHAPWYYFPLKLAKKIKDFRLILEIEEIYTLAFERDKRKIETENKMISLGNAFICANDFLSDYINKYNKKSIVCYGQYKIIETHKRIFTDEKIHLVYAGMIDNLRRAAHNAVNLAEFLSNNYVIHILGFGDEHIVSDLQEQIKNNNNISQCKVFYEGIKTGKEYEIFMSSCDVGLNLQRQGIYMQTAFPSKVLSYLSMGLNVVSSEIESVVKSKVGNIISYYVDESPESMAKTVMSAKLFTRKEIKEKIQHLHNEFVENIEYLTKK